MKIYIVRLYGDIVCVTPDKETADDYLSAYQENVDYDDVRLESYDSDDYQKGNRCYIVSYDKDDNCSIDLESGMICHISSPKEERREYYERVTDDFTGKYSDTYYVYASDERTARERAEELKAKMLEVENSRGD